MNLVNSVFYGADMAGPAGLAMAETEQQRMARLLLGQGEDQLLAPPVNPMAPPQAIANVLRGVAAKAGQLATTPGTIAAGVQPQTPGQWSEEDQFRQDSLTNAPYEWAPEMAMGMAGAGGVGVPRGAVGAAGGKLIQPEGIRAYHGSPHDFERFDLSKIGTGEGAQAYGHGLYFAENEAVAKQYRDALAAAQNRRPATINMPGNPFSGTQILEADPTRPGRMYEVNINAKPEQFLDWDKPLAADNPARQAATDVLKKPGFFTLEPESTLRGFRRENVLKPEATGADVYQTVSRGLAQGKGYKPSEATSVMREAGIPGIKYLDQGSRGLQATPEAIAELKASIAKREAAHQADPWLIDAQKNAWGARNLEALDADKQKLTQMLSGPTSNYVVFDDKLIDILRKYGLAGAAPIPPAAIAKALLHHDTTQSQ